MTIETTPQTTRDRSPRKPTDRMPSKSEQMQADAAPPLGHDLLTPVARLRSGEIAVATADIVDLFGELGLDLTSAKPDDTFEAETSPLTIRVMGRIGELLEGYALPDRLDDFADLDRGAGAMNRMAELAMWYMAELGKSDSSAS